MALITTSTMTAAVQNTLASRMLSMDTPDLIHNIPTIREKLPKHGGKQLTFERYSRLAPAMVPLAGGATPPSSNLEAIRINCIPQLYGSWISMNEQVPIQSQSKPLNQAARVLGMQLRETEDALTRNMMASTAAHVNCVGGTSADTPTEMSLSDFNNITSALMGANARKMLDGIEGKDKFGTAPVKNSYMLLGHTDLSGDFMGTTGFTNVANYPDQKNIASSEWGTIASLRVFLSSVGSKEIATSANGNDVYNMICLGLEAVGIVDQDGLGAQVVYTDPSIAGGPLWQNATLAWKTSFVSQILNESWIIRGRCTLRP